MKKFSVVRFSMIERNENEMKFMIDICRYV